MIAVGNLFSQLLEAVRQAKPNDRSGADRAYAVLLTMLEQAYAYFWTYIVHDNE